VFNQLSSFAQLRVHFAGGFANYKGDLQEKEITLQHANYVYTFGGTFNITKKLALRGEISTTKFAAFDRDNRDRYLKKRNLSFQSNLFETSFMGEYDILNLTTHKFSPFFFVGIGKYKFRPYTADSAGVKVYLQPLSTEGQGILPGKKVYKEVQYNVPIGFGVKYALSDYVYIGAEFGSRKLFTDYLDDVSGTYVDKDLLLATKGPAAVKLAHRGWEIKNSSFQNYPKQGFQRGNTKKNDNYYFGEIRISIRLPWFETGNEAVGPSSYAERRARKQVSCPVW
jgi:hypothetical protein